MKVITEKTGKLKGVKVLLRLDLNVPVIEDVVVDNFKVEAVIATINFLKKEGAKVIIISHIGRDPLNSLFSVYEYLRKFFEVTFIKDIFSDESTKVISSMQSGDIVMFENLRSFSGEKENESNFTSKLASFGDIYVNDAFAVSHREHSSIVGLPKIMESYFGLLFVKEVNELKAVSKVSSPKLFVLGGNKLETKIPFIQKFLKVADKIFVGGALANDIFKAKGFEVGTSLVSKNSFDLEELLDNKKIILPIDVVVDSLRGVFVKKSNQVLKDEKIVDAGQETVSMIEDLVNYSKFILWNGPLGDYPKGFSDGTFGLIRALASSKGESIVGGGDTEHCISNLGLEENFDFISTGGGAMLEFVANGTLVGIEAIENKS